MFDSYHDIFNARGAAYHLGMERYPHARDAEFGLVVEAAAPAPGDVIVDMPSGGGYLRPYLPDDVRFIAVETTEAFYERCTGAGIERRLCPLSDTGLAGGSVDTLISLAGLHHVEDRPEVFGEVFRVLRPGGQFVAADVRAGSAVDTFLNGFVDAHNSMGHKGRFIDDTLRDDLRGAGFAIVEDRPAPYDWRFASEAAMVDCCTLLFGLDRATPEQVLQGIADTVGYETGPGECRMHWELQLVIAEKPGA